MVLQEPECTNVCFWYIPPSLRGQEDQPDFSERLHKVHSNFCLSLTLLWPIDLSGLLWLGSNSVAGVPIGQEFVYPQWQCGDEEDGSQCTYGFNMQPRNMMGIWYSFHWWSSEFVTYEDGRRHVEKVSESSVNEMSILLLYYNQSVQGTDTIKHWPSAVSYWLPTWWYLFLSNLSFILFSLFLNAIIFITLLN